MLRDASGVGSVRVVAAHTAGGAAKVDLPLASLAVMLPVRRAAMLETDMRLLKESYGRLDYQ